LNIRLIPIMLIAVFAKADTLAYVASSSGDFGTMDLNTGAFTALGTPPSILKGLATLNGTLYAANTPLAHGTLFTLNPNTGALTAVGADSGLIYENFGSTTSGLFAVGYDPHAAVFTQDLYSINPATGAPTLIGPTGLSITAPYQGLSTNSGTLYYSYNGDLYILNTTTGAASLTGSFGGNSGMGAMLFEGGTLYGGDNGHFTIDTINTATGAATVGPNFVVTQFGNIFGLAPLPSGPPSAAPEPASIIEIILGLCSLAALRRRRPTLRAPAD
jgi:hypothetical protein